MSDQIRTACPEDIPQIVALITGEGLPAYGIEDYLDTFFVLDEGERLAGCVAIEPFGEAALLRSVVVRPERRGRDDGRRLVEAALAEAKRRGVRRAYLFTMSADGFFGRLGFREIGLEDFEPSVRASRQYDFVSRTPDLWARLKAMRLELDAGG